MPRLPFLTRSKPSQRYRDTTDHALIAACLKGHAPSWDALIDRYASLIYSICLRMGLCQADAEDVFQDICVILLRRLGDLRDTARLSSWLISMTKREAWRLQRKRGVRLISEL